MLGHVLELHGLDLEEIAEALADQECYEHRRLIDPRSGDITFWTADTGIDGHNLIDLDELDPSKTNSMTATLTCCPPGTPSAIPAPATAPSNGSPTTR